MQKGSSQNLTKLKGQRDDKVDEKVAAQSSNHHIIDFPNIGLAVVQARGQSGGAHRLIGFFSNCSRYWRFLRRTYVRSQLCQWLPHLELVRFCWSCDLRGLSVHGPVSRSPVSSFNSYGSIGCGNCSRCSECVRGYIGKHFRTQCVGLYLCLECPFWWHQEQHHGKLRRIQLSFSAYA